MHDNIASALFEEIRKLTCRHDAEDKFRRELLELLRDIRHLLKYPNRVLGGRITQQGDPMNPIQPGNLVKFLVTPSFGGAAFTLDGTKAAVLSSDPANFPAVLDPSDPQGLTISADLPADATVPPGGSEDILVTWTYTNLDGTVATVSAHFTENGLVDDVTGGTIAQIA